MTKRRQWPGHGQRAPASACRSATSAASAIRVASRLCRVLEARRVIRSRAGLHGRQVEFEDGKGVSVGQASVLARPKSTGRTSRRGLARTNSPPNFRRAFRQCVNWTMYSAMNEIWTATLKRKSAPRFPARAALFFDLADPGSGRRPISRTPRNSSRRV
jgi:hypothetical protein